MNPYLENPAAFHNFHQLFPFAVIQQLAPQVVPRYVLQTDVEVYIEEPPSTMRRFARPDVFVSDAKPRAPDAAATGSAAPVTASIPLDIDEIRLPAVHVFDPGQRRVVTAIELLSPTNKLKPEHRGKYEQKRRRYLEGNVNLVEVDLLRAGDRMPLDPVPICDYLIAICRASQKPRVGLWPLRLRDPLPKIPIPLRDDDPNNAQLELMLVLNNVYDTAGLGYSLYAQPPDPPLSREDATWAEQLLGAHQQELGID
jgi:hypothetical protein